MLGIVLLLLFVVVVIAIVALEIRNEKRYRQKRQEKQQADLQKRLSLSDEETEQSSNTNAQEGESQSTESTKKLPLCNYPKFTHERLVEMGLSEEESREFVQELIPQLEMQIPIIEKELENEDYHQMERLTHSLKGSATNLGSGGVSDLLVECNTYLKSGTDKEIVQVYLESLKHYTQELKKEYAA